MLRISLFLVGMMALSSGAAAAGQAQCPVDAVPIRIASWTKQGSVTTHSAAKISNSAQHFRAFVKAVTEHVAVRLSGDQICIGGTDSRYHSLLQFVNWRIVDSGNQPLSPAPSLDARYSGDCRVSSPWIDITFERKPVPWIRSVVRWNERQMLADQAVLAGARHVPKGVAMMPKPGEFSSFLDDYERSKFLGRSVTTPIDDRIPPDLLWLFRHSLQSTRGPFDGYVAGAMDLAVEKSAERYTKLVIALIDRCFASDGSAVQYDSILDAADLISLEQYKIDRLHR